MIIKPLELCSFGSGVWAHPKVAHNNKKKNSPNFLIIK